jgi:transcription factor S
MMFCPKCGSLLKMKNEKGKNIMFCGCGYSSKDSGKVELKEKVNNEPDKIDIVDSQEDSLLPETDAECPKCKFNKAAFWTVQTRAGDEPETKFLKCKKCSYTWRERS